MEDHEGELEGGNCSPTVGIYSVGSKGREVDYDSVVGTISGGKGIFSIVSHHLVDYLLMKYGVR